MKNNLANIRKEKKMTQQDLASVLDISRQTIISLEKGKYNPSIILALKIGNFFNIPVEDIFLLEEDD
ncbi:helix-turn-helix transcriptional regulator [Vagococcus bubulae]|uniref:Transcriptional regulator n=1 Tax=Vagococcus bubulae TaxID=1977868 RepID=A0A429ZR43_9ENTE|nr:helix-turn-helix transcriptional regulator [Vagococcus bubulae]RST96200.1 transcriptional regulator [Vagococcus bubulae]